MRKQYSSRTNVPSFTQNWSHLPLYLDWGEHLVICSHCQYALSVDGTQASSHLRKKHHIPQDQRNGLDQYLHQHHFQSPGKAQPRSDGLPPHPALQVHPGFQCLQCQYRTTSLDLMGRHLAKTHLIDTPTPRPNLDLLYQVVSLQSWTRATTTQEYWVVLGEPSPDSVEAIQDPTSIPSATTLAFLQGLRDRETRFQEVQRQQSTLEQTGTPTYEGT
jgi:hypothetical protein